MGGQECEREKRKVKEARDRIYFVIILYPLGRSIMQERRKQAIQESKFLGGDMQHTHLVKGLDYVLLDKVRGYMYNNIRDY